MRLNRSTTYNSESKAYPFVQNSPSPQAKKGQKDIKKYFGPSWWHKSFLNFLLDRYNSLKCRCTSKGAVHKLRIQDFEDFWPSLPLRRQVCNISLCNIVGIWQTILSPLLVNVHYERSHKQKISKVISQILVNLSRLTWISFCNM